MRPWNSSAVIGRTRSWTGFSLSNAAGSLGSSRDSCAASVGSTEILEASAPVCKPVLSKARREIGMSPPAKSPERKRHRDYCAQDDRKAMGLCPRAFTCALAGSQARRNKNARARSEEHTSELQSLAYLVCRLLLEKKKKKKIESTYKYKNHETLSNDSESTRPPECETE